MTHPLDHKSSLRKLPFPACTEEALTRLHAQCVTFAGKPNVKLGPKENDVILEVLNEFVFNTSKLEKRATSSHGSPALLELQALKVLLDFFNKNGTAESDLPVLTHVFDFLIMDSGRNTLKMMTKLVSLAMGTASKPLLHATGVWMYQKGGPANEKCTEMCRTLVHDYLLLVPEETLKFLSSLATVSPTFAEGLPCAETEALICGFAASEREANCNKGKPKTRAQKKAKLKIT